MKERPILFSGPMVRALLDGSKTQTRRIVKPQPHVDALNNFVWNGWNFGQSAAGVPHVQSLASAVPWSKTKRVLCPYGAPGDRLWVRETFLYVGPGSGSDLPSYREERANPENHKASNCWFRASRPDETLVWTPSIHMPRWASRITLEVTGVRVERLQDISEADAAAEGVESPDTERDERDGGICPQCGGTRLYDALGPNLGVMPDTDCMECDTHVKRYRYLWDSLNAARGYGWDENPWVWVVEFRKIDVREAIRALSKETNNG